MTRRWWALGLVLVGLTAADPAAAQDPFRTSRVNLTSAGAESTTGTIYGGGLSADGRYAAFTSPDALVPWDDNGRHPGMANDVYVRDRLKGRTIRVSGPAVAGGTGGGRQPAITPDGRFVVFLSKSDDLVSGDINRVADVFRHDLLLDTTELVNADAAGRPGNRASDLEPPSVSDDGRYVVFRSRASLTGANPRGNDNLLRKDLLTGAVRVVDTASDGTPAQEYSGTPLISGNGQMVVFASEARDLVTGAGRDQDVFAKDLVSGQTTQVDVAPGGRSRYGTAYPTDVSRDGRLVLFLTDQDLVPDDKGYDDDVYLYDRAAGTTTLVSRSSAGVQQDADAGRARLSADGTRIVFSSDARNLGPSTWRTHQVYVRDLATGLTTRVSVPASGSGRGGNASSVAADLSADGRVVLLTSGADDLVRNDTNGVPDLFTVELSR